MLFTVKDGKETLEKIEQTDTWEARARHAEICMESLRLSTPTVIDGEDNRVNIAYAGWPDRMYVVGIDGTIAYQGGPGPGGFKPQEVERWMKENLAPAGGAADATP